MTKSTLDTGHIVYDPTGEVEAQARSTAPRPASLRDLRVAVLDNSKWNAGTLLGQAVTMLEEEHGPFAATNRYVKHSFSSYADPDLIGRIAAHNDVALTAIGD